MRRLTAEDYAVDAVTAAKMLVGAWLCRRLEDGSVVRRRITETEALLPEMEPRADRTGTLLRTACLQQRTDGNHPAQ